MVGLLRGKWTDFFSFSEGGEGVCLRYENVIGGGKIK